MHGHGGGVWANANRARCKVPLETAHTQNEGRDEMSIGLLSAFGHRKQTHLDVEFGLDGYDVAAWKRAGRPVVGQRGRIDGRADGGGLQGGVRHDVAIAPLGDVASDVAAGGDPRAVGVGDAGRVCVLRLAADELGGGVGRVHVARELADDVEAGEVGARGDFGEDELGAPVFVRVDVVGRPVLVGVNLHDCEDAFRLVGEREVGRVGLDEEEVPLLGGGLGHRVEVPLGGVGRDHDVVDAVSVGVEHEQFLQRRGGVVELGHG